MLKAKGEVFAPTDGALWLCAESAERLSRGFDWSGTAGLVRGVFLPYRSMLLRSDDVALAASEGDAYTAKVRVAAPPGLSTVSVVEMGGAAYDLTRYDVEGRSAYLYLTEVVSDGTVALVDQRTTYDELGQADRSESTVTVTARDVSVSVEGSTGSLTATVRTVDYRGEPTVVRDGTRYSVTAAAVDGEWTKLSASVQPTDMEGVTAGVRQGIAHGVR
ncbi:hypothetical protein AAK967_00155 [Atopobiaceae bacterium 24-176]